MRALYLYVILSVVLAFSASAAWAGPWLPAPGEYYSEFSVNRGATDQFRDDAGNKGPTQGGVQVEGRTLTLYNELGWKDHWSVVLGVPLESVTYRLGPPTFDDATQTGFSDLLLGVRWGLLNGSQALALEADWLAPLGYDRLAIPTLGDGQQKFGGQVVYGTALTGLNGFIELAGGARYRADDKESESLAHAVAAFWVGQSLLIAGSYDGFVGDKASLHSVGPELRLRVDERLDVFAGSMHTIAGENVLDVNQFFVGVAFKKTHLNRLQGFLGGTSRP